MPPSIACPTLVTGPAQTTKKGPSHRLQGVFSGGCCTNSTALFVSRKESAYHSKTSPKHACYAIIFNDLRKDPGKILFPLIDHLRDDAKPAPPLPAFRPRSFARALVETGRNPESSSL